MERREVTLGEILRNEHASRFARYLEAYLRVEGDYGLFDRLARARNAEDFAGAINTCMRVKDRVLERLGRGIKDSRFKLTMEEQVALERLFSPGKECVEEVLKLGEANPRLVGTVIATLALSSHLIQEVRRGR